jgi:hypothetical protein
VEGLTLLIDVPNSLRPSLMPSDVAKLDLLSRDSVNILRRDFNGLSPRLAPSRHANTKPAPYDSFIIAEIFFRSFSLEKPNHWRAITRLDAGVLVAHQCPPSIALRG